MFKYTIIILSIAFLIGPTNSITKYDFNVCRIKFCADKQAACVADQSVCMDAFAKTRACFVGCTNADQLETYNKCWTTCKQANAYNANALYYAVSGCYQSLCYLNQNLYRMAFGIIFMALVILM